MRQRENSRVPIVLIGGIQMSVLDNLLQLLDTARFVDMTHPLEEGLPHWPTQPGVKITVGANYTEDGSFWRSVQLCEHSGTHIDALSHFFKGAENVDEMPPQRIMGRGINIGAKHLGERKTVTVEDIREFEKLHGEIREKDIVFFNFGWAEKWKTGIDGKAFMENWPGTSEEAAKYLRKKGVSAVGTDASALDAAGTDNPSHKVLLGNGINIIENVNNLDILPPVFGVIGLAWRLKGGSGSPVRLLALLEK